MKNAALAPPTHGRRGAGGSVSYPKPPSIPSSWRRKIMRVKVPPRHPTLSLLWGGLRPTQSSSPFPPVERGVDDSASHPKPVPFSSSRKGCSRSTSHPNPYSRSFLNFSWVGSFNFKACAFRVKQITWSWHRSLGRAF